MGRHFLLSAAIACAATATAATGKYYLVKTTGSGFSLTLSWSDRQNFGQGFGKGVTILCTNHELSQLPNGVNNVQIGGTVWSCQILKTFNSDKELAKWKDAGGKADHDHSGLLVWRRRPSTKAASPDKMPDDVAHDLRILLGILRHHRDKLSQEAVDTVNRAFTNLLNDEDLPIDRSEIPTAAGGVLAVTGTMMLITALLRKGGKPTTPLDPTLGGGGGEPTPGPTATTDDDIIDAVVRYDDEGDPEKFEEGLRRRSTDEKL